MIYLILLTGCAPKYVIIPNDRELIACPLSGDRISINSAYLADIYADLKACGFDVNKLPKIPDETGLRISISKGHLKEIKQGFSDCRSP